MPLDLSPPLVKRQVVRTQGTTAYRADAGYRADIDGLRALAILPVLLFHTGVLGFSGGYVGVDVFFVISGYLITGHIADEIARGHMSLARFYARRFRRILPALFATLILTWFVSAFLLLPSYLLALSKALLAAATSVSNIYLWQTAGYFAADSAFQPLLHTWSLSVEEQFYLVIPILMMLMAKPLRGRWMLLFGPLCLLSFALSVYATARAPTANFYLLPTRAWELGLGALIATAPLPRIDRRWVAEVVSAAALLLLLVPVFVFDDATPFPGVNALYPCLGAALLLHTGRSDRSGAKALLSARPLVAVGLISYSLYLVHWPMISLLHYREVAPPTALQIILLLVASFGLATLSWRFIEQPFRRPRPALTQRRVLLGGVAAMGIASLVGLIGIEGRGFPSRLPDFAEQVIPGHADWKPGRCFLLGNPDHRAWSLEACTRIATGPTKVLLWGDSFAGQYVPGILSNAAALQATVIQYTAAGCPPVLSYRSYARTGCTAFNAHALHLVREQKIGTVIIGGRWTTMRQRGLDEIRGTIDALERLGVRVILLGQSPEFAADIQVIAYLKGSKAPDAVNRWDVVVEPSVNQQLRRVAGRAAFVDPMPVLCDDMRCTYQDHGMYLFEDYGHFSAEGSRRIVQSMFVETGLLR